ncbi:hypothetical protein SEMRO_2373_G325280.1 [Seminavis robusta]|uniref:Uncharacterized protein n=1 Tax=Seminavis robusta TaxID=568900 RepID=A0A9N8EXD9_9STRA|nr:hypothetical protein SEMRO_2373_G325280.1 [Seminavis robusta]|eukprot:Sro2373_g325280.1 n/a (119) ;mRNA; r:3871-4227
MSPVDIQIRDRDFVDKAPPSITLAETPGIAVCVFQVTMQHLPVVVKADVAVLNQPVRTDRARWITIVGIRDQFQSSKGVIWFPDFSGIEEDSGVVLQFHCVLLCTTLDRHLNDFSTGV